jgi:hypothetical protein
MHVCKIWFQMIQYSIAVGVTLIDKIIYMLTLLPLAMYYHYINKYA